MNLIDAVTTAPVSAEPAAPPSGGPPPGKTWYRPSPELLAEIRADYLSGLTAKECSLKWGVAPGTIYRRSREEGWTKKESSDAMMRGRAAALQARHARENAEAEARLAAAEARRRAEIGTASLAADEDGDGAWEPGDSGEPAALAREALAGAARAMRLGRLSEAEGLVRLSRSLEALAAARPAERDRAAAAPDADPAVGAAPVGPVEPAALMNAALTAAARALSAGRAGDARALSQMAESLSRTAQRAPRTSLQVILAALRDINVRSAMFAIDPDDPNDPDLPAKYAYWGRGPNGEWPASLEAQQREAERRRQAEPEEDAMGEAGVRPVVW